MRLIFQIGAPGRSTRERHIPERMCLEKVRAPLYQYATRLWQLAVNDCWLRQNLTLRTLGHDSVGVPYTANPQIPIELHCSKYKLSCQVTYLQVLNIYLNLDKNKCIN